MTIRRAFEILELRLEATLEEAKQAYKDGASVWHPDRFPHNPRLRKKAERKLQDINAAYAEVRAFLLSREAARARKGATGNDGRGPGDPVEAIAEAGTRLVLSVWSYLSGALSRAAAGPEGKRVKGGRGPDRRPPAQKEEGPG